MTEEKAANENVVEQQPLESGILGDPSEKAVVTRILSRKQVLATKIDTEMMPTPEWGEGTGVKIQALDMRTRGLVMDEWQDKPPGDELYLLVFILGVVDPTFKRTDMGAMKSLNSGPVSRIAHRIMKISGFDLDAAVEARKN